MRLLFFTPLLSTVGGQERTLTDKANWLALHGHEVLFVTYEHEGSLAYPLSEQVKHVDVCCHYFSLYKLPVWRRPLEWVRLKHSFRKKMQGIVASFCPDVIVIPIPNTDNFLRDVFDIAKDIPVVIESHLAHGHDVIKQGITEKWFYYVKNPLRAISKASLLIALTEGDASYWRQHVNKVSVVPNPVTYYPSEISSSAIYTPPFRIICVGRLSAQKRFDRMIDAFSLIAEKYPSWNVDIFGSGELHENIQQLMAKKGLSHRVHLMPPTHDIYSEYQRSQFFVMSSDFEGFGLVIVEAMACGIPVVSTDCPYGPSEIIEDGKTGLLAKIDVLDLADKMEWMITHETERQQMGKEAYVAAARYKLDAVMPIWEQAYLSVI